jgi:hypothetical protein
MKKIENNTWYTASAGLFFLTSRVSLALAVQLQKRTKWPNLHKVLSAFQRLLEPAKSTSGNVNQNLKKSEVFSLLLPMYIPNLKEFG